MILPIEKRLELLGDVSNLMLVGSIQVYGARKNVVRVTLHKPRTKKQTAKAA